jgi:hypothetical protein
LGCNLGQITTSSLDATLSQREKKRTYKRDWYKNMTPEQRTSRLERQRLHDVMPKRLEAKRDYKRRCRELNATTLHPESIAMENPLFSPELVLPTMKASGAPGSTTKSSDWVISEPSATPIYMPQRSHVSSGQKHALLTCRNTMFEHRIGSNKRASNKEGDYMDEDQVDVNTLLPQSVMTNNGKYRCLNVPFG